MTFDVSYSNRSKKFLKKADKVIVKRVIEKIGIIKIDKKPRVYD